MSKGTVNKVILIGRLGKDPDMRYAPSGTAIANFSVATNHSVKDAEGNYNDQAEWHNIVVFSKQAEFAGKYLKKGSQVFIDGRLQTRSWEDQAGQKKYMTEIIANNIQSLSRAESDPKDLPPAAQRNQEDDVQNEDQF